MLWTRFMYDRKCRYYRYVSNEYRIERTHRLNAQGRELPPDWQSWEIYRDGDKIGEAKTLKDAKNMASVHYIRTGCAPRVSRTQETINKLPEVVKRHIDALKERYHDDRFTDDIRPAIGSYVLALQHAGIISDIERRLLFNYMTI